MRDELPTAAIPGADLGWMLGVILQAWHEAVEDALSDVPQGIRGYRILTVAAHHKPATQSELARHLSIDRTVLPYILDELESAGLVERHVDAKDRRARRVVITDDGRVRLRRAEAAVQAAQDEVLAGVPTGTRKRFLHSASALALSIHSAQPYLDPCLAVLDVVRE